MLLLSRVAGKCQDLGWGIFIKTGGREEGDADRHFHLRRVQLRTALNATETRRGHQNSTQGTGYAPKRRQDPPARGVSASLERSMHAS
jgi:hypothetical protein